MADKAWAWCPECHKWVPEDLMNYDKDDAGRLIRVCTPCLEGTSGQNSYVVDENHEKIKCIFCGSYDTTEQAPVWRTFRCNACNRTFRRM